MDTLAGFPANEYYDLFDVVATPVRISGTDPRKIIAGDNAVVERLRAERSWLPATEFGLFYDAWLGVAFRTTAMNQHLDAVRSAAYVSHTEPDLFGFFVNTWAVLESFAFGAFAAASILQPMRFDLSSEKARRAVSFSSAGAAFARYHPTSELARAFRDVGKSGEFLQLKEMRNILTHRASPGFEMDADGTQSRWMTESHLPGQVVLTPDVLDGTAEWTMRCLKTLISSALTLFSPQFAKRTT
jgi:hypothetical protein